MRSIWKGSISFGLVSIPVEMYSASKDREFKFVLLHDKDYSQIRYARICKEEEKEVPWSHVVKGYQTEDDEFLVMSDEDFEKLNLERTNSIELKQFADKEEIDPIYFEKPYYLQPQKGAAKAYILLAHALNKSKKVGLVTYVLHQREHIGIIRAQNNQLLLNQMRYYNEIIETKDVKLPKSATPNKQEEEMALKLVEHMTAPFKPKMFKDTYVEELKKILNKKAKGEKIVRAKKKLPKAKVIDIMSALKASVLEKKKRHAIS